MDSQVNASQHKFAKAQLVYIDLLWVTKLTHQSARKFTKVTKVINLTICVDL